MRQKLKKMLLAALPLTGLLLWGSSPVLAHDDEFRPNRDFEQHRYDRLHDKFHDYNFSRGEHRRFHRRLDREYRDDDCDRGNRRWRENSRYRQWDRRYQGDNWYSGSYRNPGNGWGWGR